MKNNNKGFAVISTIAVMLLIGFILFFSIQIKVPVGYVGIKIKLYGSEKGLNIVPLHTGRNFYNPITQDVLTYPAFVQQTKYNNIVFQDKDGLKIVGNIGIDYQFQADKIPELYEDYRVGVDTITNNYMLTWLTNSINRSSSLFEVDKLYGPDKEKFRMSVLDNLKSDLEEKGILVNNVYFVSDFILPTQVIARINSKIEATQNAMQKENELRSVEADAQKKIAEAKGIAESQIEKSKGIAESKIIEAEAIAKSNKLVNNSITQNLIEYNQVNLWNGELPQVTGGSVPFIDLKTK